MQLMNVEGLTRENVASHLQKYRLYLKRMQGLSSEGPSPSDHLFASTPVPQSLHEPAGSWHMPVSMNYSPKMMQMRVYRHPGAGGSYHAFESHPCNNYGSSYHVQGPKDSFKSYYACFNKVKLLSHHLDLGVTFAAIARSVRPKTPLCFPLNKSSPKNMADLLDRVEKYLQAKEDLVLPQEETHTSLKMRDRLDGQAPDNEPKRSRAPFSGLLTPLNASQEHILNQIKGQNIIKWPKPMRMLAQKKNSTYTTTSIKITTTITEDYKILQRKIENLIFKAISSSSSKRNNR
ncbi:hypothetical protein RJ639_038671 [Escallonia herrerae]|uniref:Uncharacterized protein n=1 Tax=Escallonia herrerae TaxID=1293975 RepID=A0AA88WN45_9ASTE|nr:hypothetical protein RJ639_038671 [Escallonia herrerae]